MVPSIRFRRDGEQLELDGAAMTPLGGVDGLGLAPVDVSRTPRLGGDGSITRGVRLGEREVYVPVLLEGRSRVPADRQGEVDDLRQRLYDMLAPDLGQVEVIHESTRNGSRSIFGYLTGGLEGDFGDSYGIVWQNLGLTFLCPDPWWLGPEVTEQFMVNPGSKPFLSATVPFFPITLAQSSVAGKWTVDIAGDGEVWPVWEVTGPGADLTISNGTETIFVSGDIAAGQTLLIETRRKRITPDRWADVPTSSRLFPLKRGVNELTVTMVGATAESTVQLTYRERYRVAY